MNLSDYIVEPAEQPLKLPVTTSEEKRQAVPVVTCDQLTELILDITRQIDDLGRKSVPLVIECGKYLIRQRLTIGDFKSWKEKHKDRISDTTIKRYIRVHNWVTSDPENAKKAERMTLNEIYEEIGIFNGQEPNGNASGSDGSNGGNSGNGGGKKKENITDCHIAFARFVKAFEKATAEDQAQVMINVHQFVEQNEPEEIKEAA